jgi:hypothetical protein
MSRPHTHLCTSPACHQRFECYGTEVENHDGWPKVICVSYHALFKDICPDCERRINGDGEAEESDGAIDGNQ